jgi:hypothetical protein
MRWTRVASSARARSQGGFPVSEAQRAPTNDAACGRRSRVVLTPRSRRQVCEGISARPGCDAPTSQATVTRKPDHRLSNAHIFVVVVSED